MDDNLLEFYEVAKTAEESLLSAVLIASSYGEKGTINAIRFIIRPEYFLDYGRYKPVRSRIYKAMLDCELAPNILNLANHLIKTKQLQSNDISLLRYYISLDIYSLEYLSYAKVVRDCAFKLKPELQKQCISHGIPL